MIRRRGGAGTASKSYPALSSANAIVAQNPGPPATRYSGRRYLVTAAVCGGIVPLLAAWFEYSGAATVEPS